jgi:hypothetical protein
LVKAGFFILFQLENINHKQAIKLMDSLPPLA